MKASYNSSAGLILRKRQAVIFNRELRSTKHGLAIVQSRAKLILVGSHLEASIKKATSNEHLLLWALVCSFLLHGLVVAVLPNFKFDVAKKSETLTVEIQQPKPPAPPPVVEPAQSEPSKKTPEPKIQPKIEPKLNPKPVVKTVDSITPVLETNQPPVPNAQSNVIAVAPTVNTIPTATAAPPVAEASKPPEPSQADVDNALGEYGSVLGRAIAKQKSYPKIAQMRGWQGDVLLDLKLDGTGKVLSASVRESSGFDALDKQALEMVRKASPFPAPPDALKSRTFNITVPVSFKLE